MPKKAPTYPALRARMTELGIDGIALSEEIGLGDNGVSNRLTQKTPWKLDEVYRACRALEIPLTEIPRYWPEGGVR